MQIIELTRKQKSAMWALFAKACSNMGIADADREEYRHRVMREECGVEHLAEVSDGNPFEKLMSRLAVDAGDYDEAAHWAGGDVKRYRFLIVKRAHDLLIRRGGLEGEDGELIRGSVEKYLAGIMFQGRMIYRPFDTAATFAKKLESVDAWMDIPVPTLRLLLQIVTDACRKEAS